MSRCHTARGVDPLVALLAIVARSPRPVCVCAYVGGGPPLPCPVPDPDVGSGIPITSNSTHGLCYSDCLEPCYANCSSRANTTVEETCELPIEPVDYCVPPTPCLDDCGATCLDADYLNGDGGYCDAVNSSFLGYNETIFSLRITFNRTQPPGCSRNVSGNCTRELLYYNVTEYDQDVIVRPDCVRRCLDDCAARCFDQVPPPPCATCVCDGCDGCDVCGVCDACVACSVATRARARRFERLSAAARRCPASLVTHLVTPPRDPT